jgi:hypothetical protein
MYKSFAQKSALGRMSCGLARFFLRAVARNGADPHGMRPRGHLGVNWVGSKSFVFMRLCVAWAFLTSAMGVD